MKILANSLDIEKNICDCIEKYKNISISIAWASAHSKAFKLLIQDKNCVYRRTWSPKSETLGQFI